MTDANTAALEAHEARLARAEANAPICAWCGEPIQSEYYYETDNGELVCEDCWDDYCFEHRHFTGDYERG